MKIHQDGVAINLKKKYVDISNSSKNRKLFSIYFQADHGDEPMENPQEVIEECLSKFCTPDYIMEPGIFTQLKRYLAIQ